MCCIDFLRAKGVCKVFVTSVGAGNVIQGMDSVYSQTESPRPTGSEMRARGPRPYDPVFPKVKGSSTKYLHITHPVLTNTIIPLYTLW